MVIPLLCMPPVRKGTIWALPPSRPRPHRAAQSARLERCSSASPTSHDRFSWWLKSELHQLGGEQIGTEHILLGLIREGEGVGAQVLASLGVGLPKVRQRVVQRLAEAHAEGDPGNTVTVAGRGRSDRARLVTCSFCGVSSPEAGRLIAGEGNAFICERCIRLWSSRLGSEPIPQMWISRSPGGAVARHTSYSAAPPDAVTPGEQPPTPTAPGRKS